MASPTPVQYISVQYISKCPPNFNLFGLNVAFAKSSNITGKKRKKKAQNSAETTTKYIVTLFDLQLHFYFASSSL
jgi:hypothetical protein